MATLDQLQTPAPDVDALRVAAVAALRAYADALVDEAVARGASPRDVAALRGFFNGLLSGFGANDAA